jgi:hypothetical protein
LALDSELVSDPVDSSMSRGFMRNNTILPLDRRGFLRLGALAGVLGAMGCEGGDTAEKLTTPPMEKGTRSRLDMMKDKADEAATKKKKK